jgi:hypothetical protein
LYPVQHWLILHSSTEDYSYFTLRRSASTSASNLHAATSLFGVSCTRQLDANELIDRPAEVTRSTVQKAVVVVSDSPQYFGAIKAQLGVVTAAWFAQKDFTDIEIMQRFQESLVTLLKNQEGEMDHYFGAYSFWKYGASPNTDRHITSRDDPRIQVADPCAFQVRTSPAQSRLHYRDSGDL